MRRLAGGIPRAFRSHRTPEGARYGAYCRAKAKRLGPLPADALPWLKEAGLLTVRLDRLHEEEEAIRVTLMNGAGRRAREKAWAMGKGLERRGNRLRAALEAAERRLEELATRDGAGPGLPAEYIETVEGHHGE